MKTIISIIVPAYNIEPYIEESLQSLTSQTLREIEIIVVNDGSTDQTGAIADKYQKEDERIKIIHQPNQGVSAARNAGLSYAKGEYIAFVDGDDWVEPNAYELLYKKAKKWDADLVLGSVIYVYENGTKRRRGYTGKLCEDQDFITGKDCLSALLWNTDTEYMPVVYTSIYKKELIKGNELKFHGKVHEDELWFPQVMYYSNRVAILKEDFYNYRQRDGSLTHTNNLKVRAASLIEIANLLIDFICDKTAKKGNTQFCFDILYRASYLLKCAMLIYSIDKTNNLNAFHHKKYKRLLGNLPSQYKESLLNHYSKIISYSEQQ